MWATFDDLVAAHRQYVLDIENDLDELDGEPPTPENLARHKTTNQALGVAIAASVYLINLRGDLPIGERGGGEYTLKCLTEEQRASGYAVGRLLRALQRARTRAGPHPLSGLHRTQPATSAVDHLETLLLEALLLETLLASFKDTDSNTIQALGATGPARDGNDASLASPQDEECRQQHSGESTMAGMDGAASAARRVLGDWTLGDLETFKLLRRAAAPPRPPE